MIEETLAYKRRWIALVFLNFSLLVIALDNTVLNLALPSISKELGSSATGLQWIVDAYVLAFAGLLLTTGSIGDRIGRKKTLQAGLLIFGCFSLGAALSRSTGMLIGMRGIMGMGGAIIMPSTLSILTSTFRNARERAQAIALWAAVAALGLGIGPLVGGWLLEHFSWSSVFYINIPIVAVALIGGYFFIEDSRDEHPRKIDLPGFILSIGGLFALVYGIIQAGIDGWGAHNVLYSFSVAVVLLTIFGFWELRSPNAMLPLSFFKNMSFTGANVALTLISFALFGSFFFFSQYMQSVHDYTPLGAGVRLLPMALIIFVAAAMSARVAQRIGTKFTVGLGIFLCAVGLIYFSLIMKPDTSYIMLVIGFCIIAVGMGVTMSPATNSIMGSIPLNKAGVGSAMNDTTRQVGGALGIAVLGTIMNSVYITRIESIKETVSPQIFGMIHSSIQGAHIAAKSVADSQLSQLIVQRSNDAFVSGMIRGFVIGGIIMAAASIFTLIVLPSRVRPHEGTERVDTGVQDTTLNKTG